MSATEPAATETRERDPFEARFARHASGLLRQFNEAGVVAAADVHVARWLARLGGESDETVLLAVALAVRGPRLGHVHVDLAQIRDNAAGISRSAYSRAFRPAALPPDRSGLAEFGMGMKSAACWFAPRWTVRTAALGEGVARTIRLDAMSSIARVIFFVLCTLRILRRRILS